MQWVLWEYARIIFRNVAALHTKVFCPTPFKANTAIALHWPHVYLFCFVVIWVPTTITVDFFFFFFFYLLIHHVKLSFIFCRAIFQTLESDLNFQFILSAVWCMCLVCIEMFSIQTFASISIEPFSSKLRIHC